METNGQNETERANISLENLGTVNKNCVTLSVNGKGTLKLWFSYETIVGFSLHTPRHYVEGTIENLWGPTTGKLLNEICPDHKMRLPREDFEAGLSKAFKALFH